ncbi:MAG: hypothetical protein HC816_08260 [Leptolyngbyaceae cyanobacterium RM1_1_2]|nr:hypothetical protein [Leptolyngbyaceae cyanobacterium RM1_1_2]
MNRPNLTIFVFGLLLMSLLAPFAGLAPLLLLLLLTAAVWFARSLWQILTNQPESDIAEKPKP